MSFNAEQKAIIINVITELAIACHANSREKGFWEQQVALEEAIEHGADHMPHLPGGRAALSEYVNQLMVGHRLALVNTEVGEWMEGVRRGDHETSEHLGNDFTQEEEEAADIIIRVLDLCFRRSMRIGLALLAKMEYNASRPRKHGKLS